MAVSVTVKPTGIYYEASINQKGVKASHNCKSRIEAIVVCWQNYMIELRNRKA